MLLTLRREGIMQDTNWLQAFMELAKLINIGKMFGSLVDIFIGKLE